MTILSLVILWDTLPTLAQVFGVNSYILPRLNEKSDWLYMFWQLIKIAGTQLNLIWLRKLLYKDGFNGIK